MAEYERQKKEKEERDLMFKAQVSETSAKGRGRARRGTQGKDPKQRRMEQELELQKQAVDAFQKRQADLQKDRRIGPFSFCIDQDLDVEILDKNQVFDDLVALEEILFSSNEPAPTNLTRGKRK